MIEDDHQIPAAAYTGTVFSDFLEHTTHAVSQAGLATSHAAGDPLVDHIIRVLGQSGASDTIFRPANGNPFDHFDYAALPDFLTIHSPEYLLF